MANLRAGLDRGGRPPTVATGGLAVLVTLTIVVLAVVLVADPGLPPRPASLEPSRPVGDTGPIQSSDDVTEAITPASTVQNLAITPASTAQNLATIGPPGKVVTTSLERVENSRDSTVATEPARTDRAADGDACHPLDATCTE